jgi:hypothetical protein
MSKINRTFWSFIADFLGFGEVNKKSSAEGHERYVNSEPEWHRDRGEFVDLAVSGVACHGAWPGAGDAATTTP